MNRLENFKQDLKDLLTKHHATIACIVDGDTHGLTYEMIVNFGKEDKWKDHKICDGAQIEPQDIITFREKYGNK